MPFVRCLCNVLLRIAHKVCSFRFQAVIAQIHFPPLFIIIHLSFKWTSFLILFPNNSSNSIYWNVCACAKITSFREMVMFMRKFGARAWKWKWTRNKGQFGKTHQSRSKIKFNRHSNQELTRVSWVTKVCLLIN
jgi:hypothetical protein